MREERAGPVPPKCLHFCWEVSIHSHPLLEFSYSERYSLSTKVPLEQLAGDLEALFSRFGPCYVKIKQGKKKDLPGAFVQFEVSLVDIYWSSLSN